jgi:hypothetical protein
MSDRDGRTSSSTSSPPQDAEFSAHQDDTTTSSSGLMTRTTHMSWSIVAIRSDPSRGRVVSLSPAAAAAAACVRSLLLSGCHWQPAATVQNGRLPSGGVSRFPTQINRPFSGTQGAASAQPSPAQSSPSSSSITHAVSLLVMMRRQREGGSENRTEQRKQQEAPAPILPMHAWVTDP